MNGYFGMRYAGFWRRAVAMVIDSLMLVFAAFVLGLFALPFLLVMPQEIERFIQSGYAEYALAAVLFLLAWLYFAGFESSGSRATIGKTALGVAVTDAERHDIGFGRASVRFFAKLLSLLLLGTGFLLVLRDERKRALHDRIAGTVVIEQPHF
jgi:uncharacterized RDD family membrane protein YckC